MSCSSESKRPNILWISIEDINPRFGCYGDLVARTPNIDRLAAQGMRFPYAFSTAGVCAPSRSAIITGMYQTSIGTHHMRTTHTNEVMPGLPTPYSAVPPHYVKTFTEYLRAAGYYCTNNHKTDYQFTPPLTAWDECREGAHWRHRPEGMPFFSVFNPTLTHESRMWEEGAPPLITDPDEVSVPPYLPDNRRVREAIARHYDTLERADARVGEILAELEEDGLADDTIVFLWSDHGAGLPRGKRWLYDAGIRVPLIVRWPGYLEPGSVSDQLVSLVDLGPTVLSVAGLDVPPHMQGQPFLGPDKRPREYVYAARDRHDEAYDMVRAVRDRRYKYIRNFYPDKPYLQWIPYRNRHPVMQEMWRLYALGELKGPQCLLFQTPRPAEELYDCEADPYEVNNLAKDPRHRAVLARMRQALDEWRNQFGDRGEESELEMVASMWPGGVQPKTEAPIMILLGPEHPGIESVQGEAGDGLNSNQDANSGAAAVEVKGPALLQLQSATQGASIAYTTDEGEDPHWRLYTQPIPLARGEITVRTLAVRIGYQDSEIRSVTFRVT